MANIAEYTKENTCLADYLEWAAMVSKDILLCKEAMLMRVLYVRGHDSIHLDSATLDYYDGLINGALKRLTDGWAVWFGQHQYAVNEYVPNIFSHPAAQRVDDIRGERANKWASYETGKYLTLLYQIPSDRISSVQKILFKQKGKDNIQLELDKFEKETTNIAGLLSPAFSELSWLSGNYLASYLHSCISPRHQYVKMPPVPFYLDSVFVDGDMTTEYPLQYGDTYYLVGTVNDFPTVTRSGMLTRLDALGFEYRWMTRFLVAGQERAIKVAKERRRIFFGKRKGAVSLIAERAGETTLENTEEIGKQAEADEVLHLIGHDMTGFGYLTTTFVVWDKDLNAAQDKMNAMRNLVEQQGFVVREETFNAFPAWLSSIPGDVYRNVRKMFVSALNFANIINYSSVWTGEVENAHLKKICGNGTYHVLCATNGRTPFRLHLFVGDVGHTFVGGPTGSGKSTLLCLLCVQFLRYPKAEVIMFDKGRSALALTRRVGGLYYEPGGDAEGAIRLQPLRLKATPEEILWGVEYIKLLLVIRERQVTTEMEDRIMAAVTTLAGLPDEQKTMTVFHDLIQDNDIKAVVRQYAGDGPYGMIFDGNEDAIEEGNWRMIEMEAIMNRGKEVILPCLEYLFYRLEKSFKGQPVLLSLDEAWLFLRHPVFRDKIQEWLKVLRKKNVAVVFATQELADAMNSGGFLDTILSATKTMIVAPDRNARAMADKYRTFGFTEREIEIIAEAEQKREYYFKNELGSRLFSFELDREQLTIIRGEA